MNHYNKVFENRVNDYMYAITKYQYIMKEEFESTINELQLKDGNVILNIDGVAFPINNYINQEDISNIEYFCIESNSEFAKYKSYVPTIPFLYSHIPFENNSIDKALIHATLHHVNREDRILLYKEVYRVLKSGGIFVVSDVVKYSKEDMWLNQIVNTYNPNGHCGIFFDIDDMYDMKSAGFKVLIKDKKCKWYFKNNYDLVDFMKHLFYMKRVKNDAALYNLVYDHLKIMYDKEKSMNYIEWTLLYFICKKE
jgi:SAM-dependent methyltransferase